MDDPGWLEKIRGYIDLGMLEEAWKEIGHLPGEKRSSAICLLYTSDAADE